MKQNYIYVYNFNFASFIVSKLNASKNSFKKYNTFMNITVDLTFT